ncbi:mast cell protease 1A-like [Echeneis naucrates]|nr:mast cell protease 1A-like [Echeneis naucrates]
MHGLNKFVFFQVLALLGQNAHGSEIINGHKANKNTMLYMASVQNYRGHVCGGFLVSEDFVMTAAHCADENPMRVVLGTHNLKSLSNAIIRHIEVRYKYPSYEKVGAGQDIMLLKLSEKVTLNGKLEPIRLPIDAQKHIKDNEVCHVAGWGMDRTGGTTVNDLRVVDVSVISLRDCNMEWKGVPDNVICAGGYKTNKGFCQGDSGGPLVCNGIAVGVVSFNRNMTCDYPDVPNVYTDVSKYLDWIRNTIKNA